MTILHEFPSRVVRRPAQQPPPERREQSDEPVLSRAETAECTCPEFCERDHDNE